MLAPGPRTRAATPWPRICSRIFQTASGLPPSRATYSPRSFTGAQWPEGTNPKFNSQVVPRYARRTRKVDEAIVGAYLAGANTRRIRKALEPLLGSEHLSKSAVSRVAARLKEQFAHWSQRDLSQERCALLFLDGCPRSRRSPSSAATSSS